MNREMQKTLAFVVAAVLMTGVAVYGTFDRSIRVEAFNDQGQKFFEDFDPGTCTTLEVFDFDPATLTPRPFKVTRRAGRWVIPSHFDYPADAKQRLIDTATGVAGLLKDSIRSDRVEDQGQFGVIDPLDAKASGIKGFGKRVTLRNSADQVLADFIIGNAVKDHPDQRYVRVPGQKRIYGVNVKVDLSTRFADWIETNLLKLDAARVRKVVIDHKGVDLQAGKVVPGDIITLERPDASTPWTVVGLPEGKEPNTETLLALATALGDLKIVGVRTKPAGLTADLMEATKDIPPLDQAAKVSLVNKGFYPYRGSLVPTKGEVSVTTDEGIVYVLRYGEVIVASGDQLSAGTEPPAPVDEKEKADRKTTEALAKSSGETSEGRYLFATASFDPAALPPPKPPADPDAMFPDDPFAYAEGEAPATTPSQAARDREAKAREARDKQVADGQKQAKDLSDRFAGWYYVTPGESYRTIAVDRPALVRDKSARPAPGPGGPLGPGGRPGLPGGLMPPIGPRG